MLKIIRDLVDSHIIRLWMLRSQIISQAVQSACNFLYPQAKGEMKYFYTPKNLNHVPWKDLPFRR